MRIGIKISKASIFFVESEGWCFGSVVGCCAFVGDCVGAAEGEGIGVSL